MSLLITLHRVEVTHTDMETVVDRFKTIGFIVIKEDAATIGDRPKSVLCILIAGSGLIDGIIPVLWRILMTLISTRGTHIATETNNALALGGYPEAMPAILHQ